MSVFLELWYNSEYRFTTIAAYRFFFHEMLDLKYKINALSFFVYVGYLKISTMNFYIF